MPATCYEYISCSQAHKAVRKNLLSLWNLKYQSSTVTKTITDNVSPAPPAIFDFIQAGIRKRMIASGQQLTSTTTYDIAGQSYTVRCRMSKSGNNQLISVCEDL